MSWRRRIVLGHEIDGRAPAERAGAAGYRHCMVAENIAYLFDSVGFTTEQLAARLLQGWEQSAEHRRNMLLAPVMHIGVGVAQNADSGRYYAVQLFGRPSSAAIRFEVVNGADVDLRYELDRETFDLAPRVTRTHTRCIDASLAILAPESGDRLGHSRPRRRPLRHRSRPGGTVATSDAVGRSRYLVALLRFATERLAIFCRD